MLNESQGMHYLSGPGLCYAPDGPTHYSLEDIMMLNNLPNLKIFLHMIKKRATLL